jgi:hypothetical protein
LRRMFLFLCCRFAGFALARERIKVRALPHSRAASAREMKVTPRFSRNKKKQSPKAKGGRAPTGASSYRPHRRRVYANAAQTPCPDAAAHPAGCARLSALHRGLASAVVTTSGSAPGRVSPRRPSRALPAPAHLGLQRAPRRPVLVPDERDPEPPRVRGYEPRPRAPHLLHFRDRLEKRPSRRAR